MAHWLRLLFCGQAELRGSAVETLEQLEFGCVRGRSQGPGAQPEPMETTSVILSDGG